MQPVSTETIPPPAAAPARPTGSPGRFGRPQAWVSLAVGAVLLGGGFWAAWQGLHRAPTPTAADQQWQAARQALEADDLPLAKELLSQCLEMMPLNAEAHFLLARVYRLTDDFAGWQGQMRQARLLQWPRPELELESRLMQAQAGDVSSVEDQLIEQIEAFHPDEELILDALVRGYLRNFSFNDVHQWCITWIQRHPNAWRPHLYRGRANQLSQVMERAITDYRRVLELKPDQPDASLWLAAALTLDGQFEPALAQYRTYLQSHPDSPPALLGIANCQFSLSDLDAARATLDQLFATKKEGAAGLLLRAKIEVSENSPKAALPLLEKAEKLAPYETDITQTFVHAYRLLGKNDLADKYERQLRDVYQQYEQLDGLRKQIIREPDNVDLRYQVGLTLMKLGREEEAAGWFRSLLRLSPQHRPTHQVLAEYFKKMGDLPRAEAHRRQADPQGPRNAKSTPATAASAASPRP